MSYTWSIFLMFALTSAGGNISSRRGWVGWVMPVPFYLAAAYLFTLITQNCK